MISFAIVYLCGFPVLSPYSEIDADKQRAQNDSWEKHYVETVLGLGMVPKGLYVKGIK